MVFSSRKGCIRHRRSRRKSIRGRKRKSHTKRVRFVGGYGAGSSFVGAPITPGDITGWPGVAGDRQGTFYAPSPNGVPAGNIDPPISTRLTNQRQMNSPGSGMSLSGGNRRRLRTNRTRTRFRKNKRGGMPFVPQDITNIGRGFLNNISSMIAGTEGVPYFNQNPLPYKQDGLIHTNKYISPPNVFQIHNNVGKSIANNSSY
jgi:hypothetical protein